VFYSNNTFVVTLKRMNDMVNHDPKCGMIRRLPGLWLDKIGAQRALIKNLHLDLMLCVAFTAQ
jgi:hypothetical protein